MLEGVRLLRKRIKAIKSMTPPKIKREFVILEVWLNTTMSWGKGGPTK